MKKIGLVAIGNGYYLKCLCDSGSPVTILEPTDNPRFALYKYDRDKDPM